MDPRNALNANKFITEVFYDRNNPDMIRDFLPISVTPGNIDPDRRVYFVVPEIFRVHLDTIKMPAAYGDKTLADVIHDVCESFELKLTKKKPQTAIFIPASFLIPQTYDDKMQPILPASFNINTKDDYSILVSFSIDGSRPLRTLMPNSAIKQKMTIDRASIVLKLQISNGDTVDDIDVFALDAVIVDSVKEPNLISSEEKFLNRRDSVNSLLFSRLREQANSHLLAFVKSKALTSDDFWNDVRTYLSNKFKFTNCGYDLLPAAFYRTTQLSNVPLCSMSFQSEYTSGIAINFVPQLDNIHMNDVMEKFRKIFGESIVGQQDRDSTIIRIPYPAIFNNMLSLHHAIDSILSDPKILEGYRNYNNHLGSKPDLFKESREAMRSAEQRQILDENAEMLQQLASTLTSNSLKDNDPKLKNAKIELAHHLKQLSDAAKKSNPPATDIDTASNDVRKSIAKVESRMNANEVALFKMRPKQKIKKTVNAIKFGLRM